ncbi:MAG TPA: aconitate hydratase [Woeseiaceae bacterium]|nr:aconitate hydratase [Woeseiaceae bacterium]
MTENLTRKLIGACCAGDMPPPGKPVELEFRQTLTQDATGTLVALTLEAMGLDRVRTKLSVQYVDHNLLQQDARNADDHLFLLSAARRYGMVYSPAGNGVSHPLHMQCFGAPGESLIGADSHTCAAGSLGMLAVGAGGADVAMVMAGKPVAIPMPEVWGIELTGELPDWVSAKDVILEMLRRHGVEGGIGRVIEYHGPGVAALSAMDRHVIANMGAELGATTTVFPSDDRTREFLEAESRGESWRPLAADEGCAYDHRDRIDLGRLVPLIARPSSPGNVVPVEEVAGEPVHQSYIGSSANPGYRDFAVCAEMVRGQRVADHVSFDVNPTTRQLLHQLVATGHLEPLIAAGARLHQAGCNGCIGMGQAPATGRNSLRTTPRNFPGRSGTTDDAVWLCSPETATASALAGEIFDPRRLGRPAPRITLPANAAAGAPNQFVRPERGRERPELVKGPNIESLPEFEPLPDSWSLPVLLKTGDDVSTDEILPAGAEALPYRSNIPRISDFAFTRLSASYPEDARELRDEGGHVVVGGANYGQGSSREHAAVAPRHLGLRVVLACSFARIHRQNLINYGVLPLTFEDAAGYHELEESDVLEAADMTGKLASDEPFRLEVRDRELSVAVRHGLSDRERELIRCGGLINRMRQEMRKESS